MAKEIVHEQFNNFLPEEVANQLKLLTNHLLTKGDLAGKWTSPEGIESSIVPPDMVLESNTNKNHPWYTNLIWDPNLNEHKSSPKIILCHNLQNTMPGRWCENHIRETVSKKCPGYEVSLSQIFVWTEGSYIWWHDDSAPGRDGAVTIYLNRRWDVTDGGQLCYYPMDKKRDKKNMLQVTPSWNTAVFLKAGSPHRTIPVIGDNIRTSVQIWLHKKKTIIS